MDIVGSTNKDYRAHGRYGSKEWANSLLKIGIHECRNYRRVRGARIQEIFYIMRVLSENGFEWQARRLQNHYHLAIKKGLFPSSSSSSCIAVGDDPLKVVVGGDSP